MSSINTEFATNLGKAFAAQVNGSADADNWSALSRDDDIPSEDYVTLREHYGMRDMEFSQVSEIERAYKAGFNSVFVPTTGDDDE